MRIYEVGGCVRDEMLGVKSKDIDFTVVLDTNDRSDALKSNMPAAPFEFMVEKLKRLGFNIFLETPEFLTVRAQFPKNPVKSDYDILSYCGKNLTADFVLARKEGEYTDGRRPDEVVPGTLEDDLARRDFTMNAIAKAPSGALIDPFNGQVDIADRIIRAVGDPAARISEDALRAIRAVRFAVTKNFVIESNLARVINSRSVARLIEDNISDERIQQELSKMFRYDTIHSLWILGRFPRLAEAAFAGSVSLDATMKTKGRG